jgi:predicted nuclease with TOPRIM domain
VRQKTEKLRKQRDDVNLEKTPLKNKYEQLKAKIENSKIEIETIEGKGSKIEEEI